jgi:hypothetical protein
MASDDDLAELIADCYDDPGLFHEAVLGRPAFHGQQERIAESVVRNRVTVVPAAHSVGKSWAAASTALHWLYTRDDAKVITTSSSNNQLVSVLWAAIKGAHGKSLFPLGGEPSEGNAIPQRVTIDPERFAIGFSAKNAESFSGYHGDNILVIADESSGIKQTSWDAIESLGYTSLLALGNPIRAKGHFRTLWDLAASGTEGYAGFHLTAFDSPHAQLTDREIKAQGLPKGLCSRTWIDNVRKVYGEGSLYWKTRVLAEFPDEDLDQLLPPSWIDRCVAEARAKGQGGPRYLAIDISKGTGRDRTVAVVADTLGVLAMVVSNRIDVLGAAQLVKKLSVEWGVAHDRIVYDIGGWAGSDMTRYLEALEIHDAVGYRGGAKGGARFANRRARAAWTLRQRLDPERPEIVEAEPAPAKPNYYKVLEGRKTPAQPPFHIPMNEHWGDLREELLALRYTHDGAKIALEKKETCQERLGRSPDLADTFLMLASLWGN